MKKKHLIILLSVFVIIGTFAVYQLAWNKHIILTQSIEELDSISITRSISGGYSAPFLLPKEQADILFNELYTTKSAAACEQHDSMQFDPPYIITVMYQDGSTDIICCMPEKTKWFRWNEYKNDSYFITNNNDEIIKQVESCFSL